MDPKELRTLLTPAEYPVLRELVLRGSSSEKIGETLGLSTFTISNHLRSIFDKLGRHSRTEIIALVLVPLLPARIVKMLDVDIPSNRRGQKKIRTTKKVSAPKRGAKRTTPKNRSSKSA
jgi:DNA-binding CsgD family transcriptional regulator